MNVARLSSRLSVALNKPKEWGHFYSNWSIGKIYSYGYRNILMQISDSGFSIYRYFFLLNSFIYYTGLDNFSFKLIIPCRRIIFFS